jgi:hypothetical protein
MTRLVIAGGPRTGKTTLAFAIYNGARCPTEDFTMDGVEHRGLRKFHTDDLIDLGWSEASEAASRWLDEPGPWIVEGVAAVRALRKWLDRNPTGKPCDAVLYLEQPLVALTDGQARMRLGCRTVWEQIVGELDRRGVSVSEPQRDGEAALRGLGGLGA